MQIPFSNPGIRSSLSRYFGVSGIPALAVLSPEGRLLCKNAKGAVLSGGAEAFPWEGEEERYCFQYCVVS